MSPLPNWKLPLSFGCGMNARESSPSRLSSSYFIFGSTFLLFLQLQVQPSYLITLHPQLQSQTQCNRSRTLINNSTWGIISDGPEDYTQDSYCEWLITGTNESDPQIITLLIHSLETECSYDYLFIYDGKSTKDIMLASLSGTQKPKKQFVATSGSMLIYLFSDTNYALEGFIAEYFVSKYPVHCSNFTEKCTGQTKCSVCIESSSDSDEENLTQITNSKVERVGHSAVEINSSVYIYGGYDLNRILNDLLILKLATNSSLYTERMRSSESDDGIWPLGVYGHASVKVGSGFFIHGGIIGYGISNELYYFNTTTLKWILYSSDHLPKLYYHTMTATPDEIIYVYGGGTATGEFSSILYQFNASSPEDWTPIPSTCCGKIKDRKLLGHTANYFDGRLLIFGGLVEDVSKFSKLSSKYWTYHIKTSVWIPMDLSKFSTIDSMERSFHSANILQDYLIIVGGYTHTHNKDERCYSNSIFLYNLKCHVLVPELPLDSEVHGVFGHQSVILENQEDDLVIIGGYRGYLYDQIRHIKLNIRRDPNSNCSSYVQRWKCGLDPSCGWCPTDDKCYNKIQGSKYCTTNLQISLCPMSPCAQLTSCQSCVLSQCQWCESIETCFKSEESLSSSCPTLYLRSNQSSCIQKPAKHGLTVTEYRNPINLTTPDSVRIINSTHFHVQKDFRLHSDHDIMLNLRGFLGNTQQPIDKLEFCISNFIQANLTMQQGPEGPEKESLWLSKSNELQQSCSNLSWSSGKPVILFPDSKILMNLNITNSENGKSSSSNENYGRVSLKHNFKYFRRDNLLPFSSSGELCLTYKTCLSCNSDSSCYWNQSSCEIRTKWNNSSSTSITAITETEECDRCEDQIFCSDCILGGCEWDNENALCLRIGKTVGDTGIKNVEFCKSACDERLTCNECLNSPGSCVWSPEQGCFTFSVYTSLYQYGKIRRWIDKESQCQECHNATICEECLNRANCGWKYNRNSDIGGHCLEGNQGGPTSTMVDFDSSIDNWLYFGVCPDIDECTLDPNTCHPNATCLNTNGSYQCKCSDGFTGDGKVSCEPTCHPPCVNGICKIETLECDCYTGTEGQLCDTCSIGFFGNGSDPSHGCQPCFCSNHGDPSQGYCDNITGDCFCMNFTRGRNCLECEVGYYSGGGGSSGTNGPCFRSCTGRTLITNQTYGYFGLEGKLNSRSTGSGLNSLDNCLWIIEAPRISNEQRAIQITILPDYHISCNDNVLRIYGGLPSFSSSINSGKQLVSSVCSLSVGEAESRHTITVPGSVATIIIQHSRAKFNAFFESVPLANIQTDDTNFSLSNNSNIQILSSDSSTPKILPRFGHTLHSDADGNSIWIFGGYSFSHGPLNDIRLFETGQKNWMPFAITVNQNDLSVPPPRYFHAGVLLQQGSELFIHGGISIDNNFLSDSWIFYTRKYQWKKISNEKSQSVRLAGHSITLRELGHECDLLLIGGFNPVDGFSREIYSASCSSPINWEKVNNITGTSPAGIYAHSAVYNQPTDSMFVFGGIVYGRDDVKISSTLYAFHWITRRWTLLRPSPGNSFTKPPGRYLHVGAATNSYMVVMGGSGSSKALMDTIFIYLYRCNVWIPWVKDIRVIGQAGAGSISNQSELIVMGGWLGSSPLEKLVSVSLPDENLIALGNTCTPTIRNCSTYSSCEECLSFPINANSSHSQCKWCTSCRQIGHCSDINLPCPDEHSCGQRPRETRFSENCPDRQCAHSDCLKCISDKCIWTRQILRSNEFSFQLHSSPVYDWNCVRKSILDTRPSFAVSSSPPDQCPEPCSSYTSCTTCLQSNGGSEGGFNECQYSVSLKKCISPAHKYLICAGGICGSILTSRDLGNCPKPCLSRKSCSECLNAADCGWCASGGNGKGICIQGNSMKSEDPDERCDGQDFHWSYMSCPQENECLSGNHDCSDSEICIDLEVGFRCECKEGYMRNKDLCLPICSQGCMHGQCVEPDKCNCDFGFVGGNCSSKCQCNQHSDCYENDLDHCIKCENNTMGPHCNRCLPLFVGDPRNGGTCIPCSEYCNFHSHVCASYELISKHCNGSVQLSQDKLKQLIFDESEPGPLSSAHCCNCNRESKTTGDKCDQCLPGYFRGSENTRDICRKCSCNGHGDLCDPVSGTNCNCQNNTESEICLPGSSKKYSQGKHFPFKQGPHCWKSQCAKCREYYLGNPQSNHNCYLQLHVDSDYCFSNTRDSCLTRPTPLMSGRTTFFAVQPKFMNVNIRINIDVTHGAVNLYLSPREDTFIVKKDPDLNSWNHNVIFDEKYDLSGGSTMKNMNSNSNKRRKRGIFPEFNLGEWKNESFNDNLLRLKTVLANANVGGPHRESYYYEEIEAAGFVTHVTITEPKSILKIKNLRNRLVITLPQESHDLRLTRFYLILQGVGDVSYGSIFFRQDQLHIDLFVFFSVFFSAFFLFLAVCGIVWKVKQNYEARMARHRRAAEMLSMARRPFAVWTLIIEPSQTSPLYPVYSQCRKNCRRGCLCLRPVALEPIFDGSSAICTMFVSLPGGPLAPCRLALGSTLSTNVTSHNAHHPRTRRRRRREQ